MSASGIKHFIQTRSVGTLVSFSGHVGVVGWLFLGGVFSSDPLPDALTDVSMISVQEFERLTQSAGVEDGANGDDSAPQDPPEVDQEPDVVELTADITPPIEPSPQPNIEPTPLDLSREEVAPQAEDAPEDQAPQERRADKITPRPQPRPETLAPADPLPSDAPVVSDVAPPDAPLQVKPDVEQTVPEDTASRIVLPDEKPASYIETSARPQLRPADLTPPDREVAEDQPAQEDAIAAALEAASRSVSGGDTAATRSGPQGPPLSGSETEGFRSAVSQCWNVDNGSLSATVRVDVSFELTPEGRVAGDVTLLTAIGGTDAAQRAAFQSARRAILRCARSGYDLPAEKYEQWKEVELTFDPSQMRIR